MPEIIPEVPAADGGCHPLTPQTMTTAAPEGTPPRQIGNKKLDISLAPPSPRRGARGREDSHRLCRSPGKIHLRNTGAF
jgi:hypothetical protein